MNQVSDIPPERPDLVVVGAGISGLSFAYRAATLGKRVLVLESSPRVGGCIRSHREADYWFELGAHTVYNSYGGMIGLIEATGLLDRVVQRAPPRKVFGLLRDGDITWLTPPRVLKKLSWWPMVWRVPVFYFGRKAGLTMKQRYSRLLGPKNYQRILSPFLSAVPSQLADELPAAGPGSLFKKRPRRKDIVRSFGLDGGLGTLTDALAAHPGITVRTGCTAYRLETLPDGSLRLGTTDAEIFDAAHVALALPPDRAAALTREIAPALSEALGRVGVTAVESLGLTLPKDLCWMPPCAFVVPVDDLFFSMVTRDPFPDDARRAFTFHFRPDVPLSSKLDRVAAVLRIERDRLGTTFPITEQRVVLPTPRVGHDRIVADIDTALAGTALAVSGNFFEGLAIEDCVQRSLAEADRLFKGRASSR
jgi:UDP-galactopyranose mutase